MKHVQIEAVLWISLSKTMLHNIQYHLQKHIAWKLAAIIKCC